MRADSLSLVPLQPSLARPAGASPAPEERLAARAYLQTHPGAICRKRADNLLKCFALIAAEQSLSSEDGFMHAVHLFPESHMEAFSFLQTRS